MNTNTNTFQVQNLFGTELGTVQAMSHSDATEIAGKKWSKQDVFVPGAGTNAAPLSVQFIG